MSTLESLLNQAKDLSESDQELLLRELRRWRFDQVLRRLEKKTEQPPPVTDEELDALVHETRREVLRARGL